MVHPPRAGTLAPAWARTRPQPTRPRPTRPWTSRTVATRTATTGPTRTGTATWATSRRSTSSIPPPGRRPRTPRPRPLPAAAQAVAGELHGAFLRVECASEEIELQYCHPQDKGIREIRLRIGGEPGRTYQV